MLECCHIGPLVNYLDNNLRKYSLLSDIPKFLQAMFEVPLLKRGDFEAHESWNNKITVL